jgi:hypothetical protein
MTSSSHIDYENCISDAIFILNNLYENNEDTDSEYIFQEFENNLMLIIDAFHTHCKIDIHTYANWVVDVVLPTEPATHQQFYDSLKLEGKITRDNFIKLYCYHLNMDEMMLYYLVNFKKEKQAMKIVLECNDLIKYMLGFVV